MQGIFKLLALASSVAALAVPDTADLEKRAINFYDSNFDDLATTVVLDQGFPVGLYNGLDWDGLTVRRPIVGAASLVPHSPRQLAGASAASDLLQLEELTLRPFATITRGPGVISFRLDNFWWGYGTDTTTTVGIAQAGKLTVVGYTITGRQVIANFTVEPASRINSPLVFADLPASFTALQNATFAVAEGEPFAPRPYLALDNVRHVNLS